MKNLFQPFVLVLLSLGLAFPAFAQQQTKPGMMMKEDMMANCKAMMEKHKEMEARMAAMDQKLEDLVKKMNDTKGNEKVEAMAAVITELVDQHTKMHQMMPAQHEMMMKHMGEHMQMGGPGSMMECPMMKEMQTQPSDEHKQHHPEKH
jgi:uncharacterized protein HemX